VIKDNNDGGLVNELIRDAADPKQVCDKHDISCEVALSQVLLHIREAQLVDYDAELPIEGLEDRFDFELLYRVDQLPEGRAFLIDVDEAYLALMGDDQVITSFQEREQEKKASRLRDLDHGNERRAEKKVFVQFAVDELRRKSMWNNSEIAEKTVEICAKLQSEGTYSWRKIPGVGTLRNNYFQTPEEELGPNPESLENLSADLRHALKFIHAWLKEKGIPI